jgi:hypothetical protein
MVTAMGIEKHAAFYRGYQPGDRSPLPVAIVLATLVALWLLVYLVSAVGPQPGSAGVRPQPHPAHAVSNAPAR